MAYADALKAGVGFHSDRRAYHIFIRIGLTDDLARVSAARAEGATNCTRCAVAVAVGRHFLGSVAGINAFDSCAP